MNDRATSSIEMRLLLGALLCAILLAGVYFGLVKTVWGHQFDDDAFLSYKSFSRKVATLDSDILDRVNGVTLLGAAIVLLIIAAARGCKSVGVIAVVGCGCAVVGAEILKKVLPWRALLVEDLVLERGFQMNTYPSGHATIGTSLVLSLILVSSSLWRPWLTIAGSFISATFAIGVLFAGWHRPSDAIGALAWSGFCMSVAGAVAIRLRGRPVPMIAHPARAAFGSLVLSIFLVTGTWLIAAAAPPVHGHAGLPFFVLAGLMIGGAFSLVAWYGWELRAVDWV